MAISHLWNSLPAMHQMPASSRYGAARPGQSCPRSNGASGKLDIIWESVNSQWDIRYTPDLDDTVVTVHARFDGIYPSAPRSTSRKSTIISNRGDRRGKKYTS